MKTLIIGNGYIGSRLVKALPSHLPYKVIGRQDNIETAIMSFAPSVIFNCAGYSGVPNVDACEGEKEKTLRDNLVLPHKLAYLAEKYRIVLAHVSSGCIYQGGPFVESDTPNFTGSFYSLSKKLAEEAIRQWSKHYNLRIRMPFSGAKEPKNLLVKLSSYPRLVNYTNSLTHVDEAIAVMVYLVYMSLPFGTYNIVNPGTISTKEIADMLGISPIWVSHKDFDKMVLAPRSECSLDCSKVLQFVEMRDVRTALSESINQLRSAK